MGSQFIGIILLVLAISAGLYAANNYSDLLDLRIEVPVNLQPISVDGPSDFEYEVPFPAREEIEPIFEPKGSAVTIDSIRQPSSFSPYLEFRISASLPENQVINITGWEVKSNSGSFIIPQAQEIYSFAGAQGDIRLRDRDQVFIYSGTPAKGNFRLNKCLGYIEDRAPFSPAVPKSCPVISRLEISKFGGECQDYLLSLSRCENPSANPPVPLSDGACHQFLQSLNYVGCVDRYRQDSDFLENEWWLWMGGQIKIFDPSHDRVQLLDRDKNLVDEYVY